ncbi:nitroreductase family protein [Sphingobacterium lumbrici]|uniref:hypothetical protein n=1 Tax=Sphingobacterium lumbrici TaxID=2559600 RepID=UPI00112C6589|nr:hypothetical protein [Sphingobacterium lumbrici]
MSLIETLNWQYATKKYSKKNVSTDLLNQIVETINLPASSAGMQLYVQKVRLPKEAFVTGII